MRIIQVILNRFSCILIVFCVMYLVSCDSKEVVEVIKPESPVKQKAFYKGTTMGFVSHQEKYGNVIFKENGVAKDPFQSVFDHGGNIARLRIDLPPYSNQLSKGYPAPDFRSPNNVKADMLRAKNAGLNTLLTFSYQSMALDPENKKNNYVAPLGWQQIAGDITKLKDSVYNHTYNVLTDYISIGVIPKIVSIGNEISWRFLEINSEEDDLPTYDPYRSATLLNSGIKAVHDINREYKFDIKIALHPGGTNGLKWWMQNHMHYLEDFDIMGVSHYHEWTPKLNDFSNWEEVIKWLKSYYNLEFMILETAQLFTTGGNDKHVDILGTGNIPEGYPNPPTTATQKEYLTDLSKEVSDAGGLGIVAWGGEWVGSDCLIYPDQWGAGSSWENKAFWNFEYNIHDGINWMKDF